MLSEHEDKFLANQENFDKDANENSNYANIKENVQPPIENVQQQKANPKAKRKELVRLSDHFVLEPVNGSMAETEDMRLIIFCLVFCSTKMNA